MRPRTVIPPLAGLLLVVLLGACSDESDNASPNTSSGSASATPEATESPTESPASNDPASGETEAAAFMDRLESGMGEEGSVHVEMTMTGPVDGTAEGDTMYSPEGSEMELTMELSNLPGGPMEMVVVDDSAFMSIPGVTRPGKFFKIDESHPAFGNFDMGLSPADSFEAFEAGLTKVDEVGAEDLQGEATTHYRLHVDAEKALAASGQSTPPGLPKTLVYDVWLDSEDRMRRLVYDLAGSKLTLDMTRWGEEVSIEPPDKQDIVEAPPTM